MVGFRPVGADRVRPGSTPDGTWGYGGGGDGCGTRGDSGCGGASTRLPRPGGAGPHPPGPARAHVARPHRTGGP